MTDDSANLDLAASRNRELILEIRDKIAFITINRPEARNAISSPIIHEILEFLDQVKSDDGVRTVLLQATGKSFIAGGDLKLFAAGLEMSPEDRAQDMKTRAARAGRLCAALATLPQPVVVAARGTTVGVGVSILCAADLAIVSDASQFRLSHVQLGLSPDGAATYYLPRQIGLKRANALALLGDAVSAREALAMGLVNWVVPDAELEEQAESLARRLAAAPATAVAEIKALFRSSFNRDLEGQIAAEAESLHRCAVTADYAEGLRAILEKRPARFGERSAAS